MNKQTEFALGLEVLLCVRRKGETFSQPAIAEVCGVSPQAVSNIERRALRKVRGLLGRSLGVRLTDLKAHKSAVLDLRPEWKRKETALELVQSIGRDNLRVALRPPSRSRQARYFRQWRMRNREKVNAYSREWLRKWRAEHREEFRAKNREYMRRKRRQCRLPL